MGDEVLAAVAAIRSAANVLRCSGLHARPDELSRAGVREGFAALQSVHAAWLGLVADLDSRRDAVPGARAGMVARTFLRAGLHRTGDQAAADVRAAHALASTADPCSGGLPRMGRALAEGTISREHVDVAIKALRRLPKDALSTPVPREPSATDPDAAPMTPRPPTGRRGPNLEPPNEDRSGEDRSGEDQEPGHTPDGLRPADPSESPDSPDQSSGCSPDSELPDSGPSDSELPVGEDGVPGGTSSAGPSPAGELPEPEPENIPAGEAVDAFFAQQSREFDSRQTQRLARHLLDALDPDGSDGFDPSAHERRGLSHATDSSGMVVGRFQLDPAGGAVFFSCDGSFLLLLSRPLKSMLRTGAGPSSVTPGRLLSVVLMPWLRSAVWPWFRRGRDRQRWGTAAHRCSCRPGRGPRSSPGVPAPPVQCTPTGAGHG